MIKLFELFAGYGGASFALKKAGIPFECVGYSEIDKYAIQCYEQNHWNSREEIHYETDNNAIEEVREPIPNYGDCTKIDPLELPDFDLLTGGHPCQSYSQAGKRLGIKDKRGQLIYNVFNIIRVKKPKYVLLENVKGLLTIDKGDTFENIMEELSSLGYNVDFRLFNSKEHGIPQNRERVFYIGVKKDD